MEEYKDQFLSKEEGAPRAAVKRLSRKIEEALIEATINAPDWYVGTLPSEHASNLFFRDTLYAARMARDLLWEAHKSISLDEFVVISQTYVAVSGPFSLT